MLGKGRLTSRPFAFLSFLFFSHTIIRIYNKTKGGLFINTMVQNLKTKTRRTKYNTIAIKEAADALLVAQAIGMDIQDNRSYKNKVSVLCPGHDDRHHGSCYLTERGCHCYVCNQDFDVFDMVKLQCNLSFRDAAGLIADLCGGRERFLIDDTDGAEDSEFGELNAFRMISRPDMELIGVYSTPVYVAREVIPSYYEQEREPGTRNTWYPGDPDKDEDDYVVVEEMVIKNPLWDLLKTNPQVYAELIQNKAWEALEREREMQRIFLESSRSVAREFTPTIRKIEAILIEYGGSLRNPPDFILNSQK